MDHMETLRAFEKASPAERDRSFDELIELVGAVDGLLKTQVEHDLANLSRHLDRRFTPTETEELRGSLLRAKRWTFLESGVTHPRFVDLFVEVATPEQQQRVSAALAGLLGSSGAAAA